MKILVLDDNYRDISPLLNAYLASSVIIYTDTPYQATQKLKSEKFDLLILDGDLGSHMTGPQTLKKWKEQGLSLPPVVMLSASEERRQEGLAAGAIGAIAKESCSCEDFRSLERFAPS